ncbi:DUF6261 family protein [Capnocytophaga sp.]|uniref:DUF6261 family protein n=1 Tax=Capnocytophaga sp. TaxID=44737 RepID=UPI0026DC62C5|nr:DUF6261 family protein [Capnocytophaga sp.]MDO5105674.1 DUF6261 family protein [Capnocytophaga sp.]
MKNILNIKSITLDSLNNLEYAQFVETLLGLIKETTPEAINVEESVITSMKGFLNDLTEATKQTRFSTETPKIADYDKERSKYIVYLMSVLRVERNNIDPKRKEAADILYINLKNYIGIQSIPTRQKTNAITGLLIDIRKPNLAPYASIIGFEKTIEALEEANKNYQKHVSGRREDKLTNALINTNKVRREANALYKYISKCAYATYLLQQSAESKKFIDLLNGLIAETISANKQRLAQANSNKSISSSADIEGSNEMTESN